MIIDIHNHIGLSKDGGCGTIEALLANMQKYDIRKAVIFATDEKDKGETFEAPNTRIFVLKDQYPDKIIAFARLVPSVGDLAVKEFQRCLKLGSKGLKLKAKDGFSPKESSDILDLIPKKNKFPVIVHTAHNEYSQLQHWEPVIEAYPHINFVLAHAAKDHYRKCIKVIKKYSNVYVDTSTLSCDRTRHVYEEVGPSKILFASDFPYSHPAVELAKFEVLISNKDDLEMILWKNAFELIELE